MKRKGIIDLVGLTLKHKKLGLCEVIKVLDCKEGKLLCKVLNTGQAKKLIFSAQYFDDVSEYKTIKTHLIIKDIKTQIHREVNYKKYREHPLVKDIDRRETG